MAQPRLAGERFVDPSALARIGNLDLVARFVVDGFVSGLHRARHRGVSTDFAEHRAYVPGDDVRHVDWRVYARTDRLYVKVFEAETNADLVLALDVSRSMDYASAGHSKLDYGRFVVATLAHLASTQRDRVGLATFDSELRARVPASGRHRDRILHEVANAAPGGASDLPRALALLAEQLRRRGIVVVVSDFYVEPVEAARALEELAARGHDVLAVHVLDPRELRFDVEGSGVLEDLESGERLPVVPERVRGEYLELIEAHLAALAAECGRRGIDYACFDTSQPLDALLHRHLAQRARATRTR